MTTVLDEIESRFDWNEVPLRAVGVKVSDVGYPNSEPLSVFLDAGVVPRSSREDNHNQLGESLEKYQRVLPNDLVFNKLRTWQGGFGISDYEGIVSPAYIIVRLNTEVIHPKFLGYLLKSKPYLAELTRLSKWMPPTQFDISWESLRDLRLKIPTIEEQRRIADDLEARLLDIDKLIAHKRNQIDLIKSYSVSKFLQDLKGRMNNLSASLPWLDFRVDEKQLFGRMFEISLGKMLQTEPKLEGDFTSPYLNSANVSNFENDSEKRMWVNPKELKSCQVQAGDLIVIEGGDVGRSNFYSGEPIVIQNSLHRVRSRAGNSLNYAHAILNAIRQSKYLDVICNVATIRHFTLERFSELSIPYFSTEIQKELGDIYVKNEEWSRETVHLLESSIIKFEELKSSIVTRSLTGEYEISRKKEMING